MATLEVTIASRIADHIASVMAMSPEDQSRNKLTLKAASRIIKKRKKVESEDSYKLRVLSVSSGHTLLESDIILDGAKPSESDRRQILINYSATTPDLLADSNNILREAVKLHKEGKVEEAKIVASYATNQTLRSRILFTGEVPEGLPTNGQTVQQDIEWVTPETGPNAGKRVLRAVGRPAPVEAKTVTATAGLDSDLDAEIMAMLADEAGATIDDNSDDAAGAAVSPEDDME